MATQEWFSLIHAWKDEDMGKVGITLPFLVGALAYKESQRQVSGNDVRCLLKEMTRYPKEGFVIAVSWCPIIDAPVLSAESIANKYRMTITCFLYAGQSSYSRFQ